MQDGAAQLAVGLIAVRHTGGMPAEDCRHTIHEHRGVAQPGVAGMRGLSRAVAQPVVFGLPIHLTHDGFGFALVVVHFRNSCRMIQGATHTRRTARCRISLHTTSGIGYSFSQFSMLMQNALAIGYISLSDHEFLNAFNAHKITLTFPLIYPFSGTILSKLGEYGPRFPLL